MKDPIVRFDYDEQVYVWPEVTIRFSAFHEGRDRSLQAMLEVYPNKQVGGKPTQYFIKGQHNLAALQTQERVGKHLATKVREITGPEWVDMVTQAAISSQAYWERGEPVTNAMEVPQREEHFLVDPLLPFGQVTMFYADGQAGKSLVAKGVMMALQLGLSLPKPIRYSKKAIGVYCDWEDDACGHRDQMEWLARGWGINPLTLPPMYHLTMNRRLVDDLPRIRKTIRETKASFIVVDSISAACGMADLKEAEMAIRTLTALRLLSPVTSLVLHHMSKNAAGKEDGHGSPYGTVFFRNYARRVWEVRSYKSHEQGWLRMGLYLDKVNWRPGPISEIGIEMVFDNELESVKLQPINLAHDAVLSGFGGAVMRIWAALEEPATIKAIVEETGLRSNVIRSRLHENPGKFVNLNPGRQGRGKESLWARRTYQEE